MLWLERRLILIVSFLLLGLAGEWASRWIQGVRAARAVRVALVMLTVGLAFTLASDAIAPNMRRSIKRVHGSLKPKKGAVAGIATALVLVAFLYMGYYFTFS